MRNQGGCLGQDIPKESCDNVLFILQKGYAILLLYLMISFVNYKFPEWMMLITKYSQVNILKFLQSCVFEIFDTSIF